MSTAEIIRSGQFGAAPQTSDAEPFSYRALSSYAVLSLALGVLSCMTVLDWWLAVFPASAVLLGLFALLQIRWRPEELTGGPLAKIGIALALVFWAGGWSWLGYVYATEVPEGYERI